MAAGRTRAGEAFRASPTLDMFATLASPRRWGLAEITTVIVMALHLYSAWIHRKLPVAIYIVGFMFWRIAYNLGLGMILYAQSEREAVSEWLRTSTSSTQSLVAWATTQSLRDISSDRSKKADTKAYRWEDSPVEFNAWIAFRAVAMLVLVNDGTSYFALFVACFRPLQESSVIGFLGCLLVGLALIAFSFWSKAEAHESLGDFGWYWGDFFFLLDGEFVLDGVFQFFPHPMYTAGYAAYYGMSLIARSYTLLAVSLVAHGLQMAFLFAVESPHIDMVYGTAKEDAQGPSNGAQTTPENGSAADPRRGVDRRSREPVDSLLSPSILEIGDVAFWSTLSCTLGLFVLAPRTASIWVSLFTAARYLQWGVLGSVLRAQSLNGSLRIFAERRGKTIQEAYQAWQHLWLLAWCINHAMFGLTALRVAVNPYSSIGQIFSSRSVALFLSGGVLIALGVAAVASSCAALGKHGFFYADFFDREGSWTRTTEGPYRYLTHPECALGYLAYYGVALLLQSWSVAALAIIAQLSHIAFVVIVETPYTSNKTNKPVVGTPIEQAAYRIVPIVYKKFPALEQVYSTCARNVTTVTQLILDATASIVLRERSFDTESSLAGIVRTSKASLYRAFFQGMTSVERRLGEWRDGFDSKRIVGKIRSLGIPIEPVGPSKRLEGAFSPHNSYVLTPSEGKCLSPSQPGTARSEVDLRAS